jgi:hypothetical protein
MKFSDLKAYAESVDSLQKVASILLPLCSAVASVLIVGSRTLGIVMAIAALFAGALGFYFTIGAHGGRQRGPCLKLRNWYAMWSVLGIAFTLIVLLLTDPDFAKIASGFEGVRELLFSSMLLLNVLVAAGVFVFVYFLVGAILLSSPRLWTSELRSA